jgi:hypothetical protein
MFMLSYSDYKIKLTEADEPAAPAAAASAAPPSLPDPISGMPPGGGSSPPPDFGGMGGPSMDLGTPGAPSDPNQKPVSLDLKAFNFFDALEKLLKKLQN